MQSIAARIRSAISSLSTVTAHVCVLNVEFGQPQVIDNETHMKDHSDEPVDDDAASVDSTMPDHVVDYQEWLRTPRPRRRHTNRMSRICVVM